MAILCCCAGLLAADRPYRGRVLVVVTCHADDFSIFAGGTIAKLIDQGYTGYLVRVTDDEKSGGPDPQHNAAQNDREVRETARIIGLRELYSLPFKNDELGRVPHVRLRDAIMYDLRKLRADTIYTFDPYAMYGEENFDHLAVARAAEDAARNAGNPLYAPDQIRFGVPAHTVADGYYWGRAPMDVNTVVDTSAYLDRKSAALDKQRAQFGPDLTAYFRRYDEAIGRIYGMKAAEVSHHIVYAANGHAGPALGVAPKRIGEVTSAPASPPALQTFAGKKIVVISPHGADYVRAVGGTIAKAAQQGARIYLVRVTDDELHGGDLSRTAARVKLAAETRRAAEVLGVRQVIDLDLKDGELAEVSEPELRARFAEIFRFIAPDAVFTCDPWAPYDPDSDDARMGHAVDDAAWSASHLSFYPEIVLEPKTQFKVISNRYYWAANGAHQEPNHREDVRPQMNIKARAVAAMPSAFGAGEHAPAEPVESFYDYHAANPLGWFQDWLATHESKPVTAKPLDVRPRSKRALVITPELGECLKYAGAVIRELKNSGTHITLISVRNGANATSLGYREGELSAVPPVVLRDRLLGWLQKEKPDTVLLPDPWEPYSTHEATVVGGLGADAVYRWSLAGAHPVRVLYWRAHKGSFEFGNARNREYFEVATITGGFAGSL